MKKNQIYKISVKEKYLQKFLEDYLKVNKLDYIRIPDWGFFLFKRLINNKYIQQKDKIHIIKLLDIFSGLPDCKVYKNIKNTHFFFGIDIELKTEKGRLNKNQKDKNFCICKSTDEIINTINKYKEKLKKIEELLNE